MLNTYGYRENSGFVGIPKQIVNALNENKLSIDVQTTALENAIKKQTETQHQDVVEMERTFTGLFGALAKTFKNIFTTDKGDIGGETFYEMVQRENNETQEYMAAHTETMASSLEINAELLKEAIEASTEGDTVNFNNLIQRLKENGEALESALTDDVVDAIRNEIINSGSF